MLLAPMETDALKLWQRYNERTTFHDEIGLTLDLSRVDFPDDFFTAKQEAIEKAKEYTMEAVTNKLKEQYDILHKKQ